MPCIADGGRITKKLTRIEPQSSLRSEVTRACTCWPATSKRSVSPRWIPSVLAMPSSTEAPASVPALPSDHRPAITRLPSGSTSV
ncbi:hypothetical protein D9M72_456960 [compost metagenome]